MAEVTEQFNELLRMLKAFWLSPLDDFDEFRTKFQQLINRLPGEAEEPTAGDTDERIEKAELDIIDLEEQKAVTDGHLAEALLGRKMPLPDGGMLADSYPVEFGLPTVQFTTGTNVTLDPCLIDGTDIAGAADVKCFVAPDRSSITLDDKWDTDDVISFIRFEETAAGGEQGIVVGQLYGLELPAGGTQRMVVQKASNAEQDYKVDWVEIH